MTTKVTTSPTRGVDSPTVVGSLAADELFGVLAGETRRSVLQELHRRGGETDRESLAAALGDGGDEDATRIRLHHTVLPRLERVGLVSCPDDDTVTLTDDGNSVVAWLTKVTSL